MEISPLDRSNGRSLVNMVPMALRKVFRELGEEDFGYTEEGYEREYGRVDASTNLLRIAFWREYEIAQSQMRQMGMEGIAFGCGMLVGQVKKTLSNRSDLRWVLIPPLSYENFLDEALAFGLQRLRKDILGAKIYDDEGRLDVKAADLLLKAVAFMDMRKNGAIKQRIESVSHTINHTAGQEMGIGTKRTLREINERIEELERKGVVGRAREMAKEVVDVSEDRSIRVLDAPMVKGPYPDVGDKPEGY